MANGIKRKVIVAIKYLDKEIAMAAKEGKFASGLSSEGYKRWI